MQLPLQEPKNSSISFQTSLKIKSQKFQRLMADNRIYSQSTHQKLIMSGWIFKMGPLFQRMILNKQGEYVILNDLDVTFWRLKRSCIIYLGGSISINKQNEIVNVDSVDDLKKYFQQLDTNYDKDVTFYVIYQEHQKHQHDLLKFLRLQKDFTIKYYQVKERTDEDISCLQQIYIKIAQIKSQQKSYQFPSFSEISIVGNNKKINQQRFTMYTFLAGLDFQQARRDLVKFYEYILKNQIFFYSAPKDKKDLLSIIAHYKNYDNPQYRNSKKILRYYSYAHCCYKLINMCLRSLIDPRDLAYIRLLFLDIFLSVIELFIKQKQVRKNFEQRKLYRGCQLSLSQIYQLTKLTGQYIQMNGFLSISKKKATAEIFSLQNKDNIRALIVIDLPYIEKSIDIFHSFAFIQQVSQYGFEQQVLFNPLNAFNVLDVKEIDQKYYQIHLQYADIARLLQQHNKQKTNKSTNKTIIEQNATKEQTQKQYDIIEKISTNFRYHKSMFTLNRTQGEVFWRNSKKQCSHLFYSGLIRKMLEKEKRKMQDQPEQYLNHKFKFIKVQTLYNQLKEFVPNYQWFSNQDKNLQLVTRLVINNKDKALQIYFYTSKMFTHQYCYQRSLIYSLVCFQIFIEIYKNVPSSTLAWMVASDIGLALYYLGKIKQSLLVFDWSFKILEKAHNQIKFNNLQMFIFTMCFLLKMGDIQKYQKFKKLSIEKFNKFNKDRLTNLWKILLEDLTNTKIIKQFLKYNKQVTQSPSQVFIKIIVYIIEYLEKQLDCADLSNEKLAIIKEDLEIAANCLVNFQNIDQCYMPLSKLFVIYFGQNQQKYDFAQIQKTVASRAFNNMFDYKLQIYLITLNYVFKNCKKLQIKPIKKYMRLMIGLGQYLRKKKNRYLNDIYYTVINLYCEATILWKNNKLLQNKELKNKQKYLIAIKKFCKVLAHHLEF